MFDISFSELLVIGVIALVVIGPERLPKVARTVGHLLGRAQRYVSDVKGDIQREVELDELKKMKEEMENAARDVTQSMQDTENSIRGNLDLKNHEDYAENTYQSNTTPTTTQPTPTAESLTDSSASSPPKAPNGVSSQIPTPVSSKEPVAASTAEPLGPTQGKLL